MPTSKVTLYATELLRGRNWKIDSIENYLKDKEKLSRTGGAYVAPALDITINIPCQQNEYMALGFNYLKLQPDDGGIYYYYITGARWSGQMVATLTCHLDTLNTLDQVYMTDRTRIEREHRDRWVKNGSSYYAKVDEYAEGINTSKDELYSEDVANSNHMYLVQISRNATTPDVTDTHPYGTYICYDDDYTYASSGSGNDRTYYAKNLYTGWAYYVTSLLDEGRFIYHAVASTAKLDVTIGSTTKSFNDTEGVLRAIKVYVIDSSYSAGFCNVTGYIRCMYYSGDTFPYSYLGNEDTFFELTQSDSETSPSSYFTITNARYLYQAKETGYVRDSLTSLDSLMRVSASTAIKAGSYFAQVVKGIKNIDRTNSSILAIYQVPYYSFTSGNASFVPGYCLMEPTAYSPDFELGSMSVACLAKGSIPSTSNPWQWQYESKIWSPELADIQVMYQGENILNFDVHRFTHGATPIIKASMKISEDNPQLIRFHSTCTAYSFQSAYEQYSYLNAKYSVPLFTNSWNEYVRNGYNYDVGQREREKRMQEVNIAINGISAAISLATPAVGVAKGVGSAISAANSVSLKDMLVSGLEGNPTVSRSGEAIKALSRNRTGVFGSMLANQGVSAVGSMVNAANAIESANVNYQYSLNQKVVSRTAVNGNCNDYLAALDNRVSLQVWVPRQYVRYEVAKMFHLTGYSHPVMETPDVSSRYWFNYLRCSPVYDEFTINNNDFEWLNDLTSRYEEGVTVFHYHDGYDLDQEKENLEVSLL